MQRLVRFGKGIERAHEDGSSRGAQDKGDSGRGGSLQGGWTGGSGFGVPALVRTCMPSMGVIEILPNEDWYVHMRDPKLFPSEPPYVARNDLKK